MDKAAERRRRRRERIEEMYRTNYCIPMCAALAKESNCDEVQRLATRSMDFKYGVLMADPNGHWHRKFNQIFNDVQKIMGVRENGGTRNG